MALLRKHFVAFALDNAGAINMTATEAAWLKDRGGRGCTAGITVFSAGGKLLSPANGGNYCYDAEKTLKVLQDALAKFKPDETVEIRDPATAIDPREVPEGWRRLPRAVPRPAKDGLVLFVTRKALGLPTQPKELPKPYTLSEYQLSQKMLTVDRIWAGKGEADDLARGEFSDKLKQRLAVHVGYVMTSTVTSMNVTLREQRVTGSFLLGNGERCELQGFVEVKGGKIRRFDVIVKGRTTGKPLQHGLTSIGLVPEGTKQPAALAFMLADPNDELARVQPAGSHDLEGGAEK